MLEDAKLTHKRNHSHKNRAFNIKLMDKHIVIDISLEKTAQDLLNKVSLTIIIKIREHPSTPNPERLICLRTLSNSITLDYILSIPEERGIRLLICSSVGDK